MQLVLLAGELGEKYGQQHEYYNLRTPADAIKLLCVNYPSLQTDLTEAHKNGIGYKVIQGGAAMGYDELHLPFGSRPLMVVPVISGSGSGGTSQILLGVGLIAASFLFPGAGLFGTTGLFGAGQAAIGVSTTAVLNAAAVGTAVSAVGASLVLSGTANLISPQPQVPRLSSNRLDGGTNVRGTGPQGVTRGASGQQSYAFNGPSNTVGTGATIPVIYGRVITGGHLVAIDIDVSDTSDPLRKQLGAFSRSQTTINNEFLKNEITSTGDLDSRKFGEKQVFATDAERKQQIFFDIKDFPGTLFGGTLNKKVKDDSTDKLSFSTKKDQSLKYPDIDISNKDLKKKRKEKLKKVDVLFELSSNLYDYVGDETSTIIDGFISYNIILRLDGTINNAAVANASATLQGMFTSRPGRPFTYGHRLEVPTNKQASDDAIKIEFEIVDASVDDAVTFKLLGYGFDLL